MPKLRGRSNRPHPSLCLMESLQVSEAIADSNASHPMNRILLAEAMGFSPSSSGFRDRIAASAKYGLTEGNYSSEMVSLTPLGVAVTRPRNDDERIEAKRNAFRSIPLFEELVVHFANAKLPQPGFLKNTLERDPFNIDPSWSMGAAEAFTEDAREVGYLREVGGSPFIVIDGSGGAPVQKDQTKECIEELNKEPQKQAIRDSRENSSGAGTTKENEQPRTASSQRPVPMQLFVAHGPNRKALDQLKDILQSWKVPYLVAVDEANAGRPISEKVADTMRQCSAGIFIFTADEKFNNDKGEVVYRPSQNVVYELGAASLLYGRKIVILKESGVTFPSDFSDLGWIEFDKDALSAKAMELLREMIALDAVRIVSAGSG